MQISRRLTAAASMVTEGMRLADVGTDHAYIPIFLVKEGKIPSALAMDINQGPIERAQQNIRRYGLEGRVETRRSDGLHAMQPGEADSVLIAGMGGLLIVRILEEGKALLEGVRELILQPQSEIRSVREYLKQNGYFIADEELILEEGKFYMMMRAVKEEGADASVLRPRERENAMVSVIADALKDFSDEGASGEACRETAEELALRYGPVLLSARHPLLREYLDREAELTQRVLDSLKGKETEAAMNRREELLTDLYLLNKAGIVLEEQETNG